MDCSLDLSPEMLEIKDKDQTQVKLGIKILEGTQTPEEFINFILSFDDGYDVNEFLYDKFSSYTIYGKTSDNWRYSVMVKMVVNCFNYYLNGESEPSNYNGYVKYDNDNKIKVYLSNEEHTKYVYILLNHFNEFKQHLTIRN